MDTVWSWYVSVGKQKVGLDDFIVFKCETEVHSPTQRAPCVLVSFYRLSSRLGHPIRQQRMLRSLGIELWINLQWIGWQGCLPPNWLPIWWWCGSCLSRNRSWLLCSMQRWWVRRDDLPIPSNDETLCFCLRIYRYSSRIDDAESSIGVWIWGELLRIQW